jgi:hypothetical protein
LDVVDEWDEGKERPSLAANGMFVLKGCHLDLRAFRKAGVAACLSSLFRKASDARRSEHRTAAYWVVREDRKRSDNAADDPSWTGSLSGGSGACP